MRAVCIYTPNAVSVELIIFNAHTIYNYIDIISDFSYYIYINIIEFKLFIFGYFVYLDRNALLYLDVPQLVVWW